jgi:hypothetical protein
MAVVRHYQKEIFPAVGLTTGGATFQKATLPGLGVPRMARMIYDFSKDGGVIGPIVPKQTAFIPANAIIIGGIGKVIVAPLGTAGATFAVGTDAGSSAASLFAALVIASLTIGTLFDLIPVYTAVTAVKMTAAGNMQATVAVHALTAGIIDVTAFYVHPSN